MQFDIPTRRRVMFNIFWFENGNYDCQIEYDREPDDIIKIPSYLYQCKIKITSGTITNGNDPCCEFKAFAFFCWFYHTV